MKDNVKLILKILIIRGYYYNRHIKYIKKLLKAFKYMVIKTKNGIKSVTWPLAGL